MSDFKFSCPSCGQHLAADESWTGKQIQCPQCQAPITVSAAPAAPAPAPAPVTPPPPRPAVPRPPPPAPRPVTPPPLQPAAARTAPPPAKRSNTGLWIGLGVAAFCFMLAVVVAGTIAFKRASARARQASVRMNPGFTPPPNRPRPSASSSTLASSKDPKVTTDPRGAQIPDSPVAGTVKGAEFKIDSAETTFSGLQIKQGKEFFPDASLNFFLFLKPGEKLEGRKIVIGPDDKTFPKPHIHVARKEQKNGVPRTQIVTENYALRLEFGERQGDKIPGRLFLEMGESLGTKVSGTFTAEAKQR